MNMMHNEKLAEASTAAADPNSRNFDCASVQTGKVGILLANLGTPDHYSYWPMRRYLSEFLSDRRVVDYSPWLWQPLLQLIILSRRPFASGAAYKSIWNHEQNESPLLTITKAQTEKMADMMQARFGDRVVVDFCMRYGNPSTQSKVEAMYKQGCNKIVFFPLYPQYAGATSATACDQLFRVLQSMNWQPLVRTVEPYYAQPLYIEALAQSVQQAYAKLEQKPDILVTSYHGVPKRYVYENGDPYSCQCMETTRLLKERLGWDDSAIVATFQSKFGPEEWLQPYTVEEVARLAESGKKRIAVIAPAFSADCIETLEEINEEIKESFEAAGGESFTYIPCLNDSEAHMKALAHVVETNLRGWLD